jgi:NADH:ubiquinone oxidoreductase subunit 2 (subunit N)
MKPLIAVIGTAGTASIILVLVIMARLTQKWEVVTKSRSHYRLFYVAAALVTVASLARLVRIGYQGSDLEQSALGASQSWFYLCFYHIPLIAALTISAVITWRNWRWLLREKDE